MAKGFNTKNYPFSIYYNNRNLFTYYDHYLMYFDLKKIKIEIPFDKWHVEEITVDNIKDCDNEVFSLGRMKRYLLALNDHVRGFLFRDLKTQKRAGFLWIMYTGKNEFQYRVRKTDALIFDVYVFPEFRGLGLCGYMLQYLFGYLKNNLKKSIVLGVRTDNKSAIKAYQKAGGVIKSRKRFIQLFHRFNFPYYSV